jgi:hypothetical protein
MAYQLFRLPKSTNIGTSSFRLEAGAKAYFYATGTTTPQNTYQDSVLLTPHANPVVADSAGVLPAIYLDPSLIYSLTLKTSAGVLIYTVDPVNDASLDADAIGRILYPLTTEETAASATPVNFSYPYGHLYRYKSGSLATDSTNEWSAALQAAISVSQASGCRAVIPGSSGFYKITTAGAITDSCQIEGDGPNLSILRSYGCDGFDISAGVQKVMLQGFSLLSYSGAGAASPKTNIGVDVNGASGNTTQYVTCRDLNLTGWATGVDWSYTWFSTVDHCVMTTCTNNVRLFGQTVNNFVINGSILSALAGNASITTVKDGATRPEGLHVADSFLGEGDYGIQSDGILGLFVSNCVIDLIQNTGVDVTNAPAMSLTNSWIYAANYGVRLQNLGVAVVVENSISNCHVYASAANGKAVLIGINNLGVNISGGSLTSGGSGTDRCLYIESGCDDIAMVGTHLINAGSNASVFTAVQGFTRSALTGNATVQFNAIPTIASAAALVIPKVGEVFAVSGTTNVTSISSSCDYITGKLITLRFDGALTMTDGSNLSLAGNFVTTGSDCITITNLGGVWYEVCRSVN